MTLQKFKSSDSTVLDFVFFCGFDFRFPVRDFFFLDRIYSRRRQKQQALFKANFSFLSLRTRMLGL